MIWAYKSVGMLSIICITQNAVPIQVYGYALFKNDGKAVVKYPMEGQSADVAGRSFHHGEEKY